MFSVHNFLRSWNNFFFSPVPTEGLAIFRMIWASLLFLYLLFDLPNIADFYGPHAIISLETTRQQFLFPHANIFHWLGNGYGVLYGIILVYGLALITTFLGFYTRSSLAVVLICLVSLHQRNIWLLSSSECLMRIMTILLVCAPCGHTLSLDSYFARKEGRPLPKEWAPWALRLIQIQLSVVYVWTVWHKLKGDTWIDGTALYYATRLDSMTNFPVPFFLDNMLFIKISTWGTLALELSLGTLIWFKEFRKPLILAGLVLHLGIEYMMSIPFFEVVMMALLVNFFTPEELRAFAMSARRSLVENVQRSPMAGTLKQWIVGLVGTEKSA